MELIEKFENRIDKILEKYEHLESENNYLKIELEKLKNRNDELVRNNQDMLLKIDSTLTLAKVKIGD